MSRYSSRHCNWQEEYPPEWNVWDTQCGETFQFTSDTPEDNGFQYCPYCGKKIVEIRNEKCQDEFKEEE